MKYRIIIADDERKILQLVKKLGHWEELDIEIVDECYNGQEALDSIVRNQPDIVLSDIKMPIYDGIQLIQKTREQGVDTLFVLLSGYRHFEYARSAIQLNVMDYLLKPIDEQQLNETLEKVCRKVEEKRKKEKLQVLEAEHERQQLMPFWEMLLFEKEEMLKKYLSSVFLCNEKFGTEFAEGCFQIISIVANLNAILNNRDSLFSDKMDGFISRIFKDYATVYYYYTDKGHIIILNYREDSREAVKNGIFALFCDIRDLKDIYGDFRLNFGCSTVKNSISGLPSAFGEAEAAQWGRLVFMGNNIIEYHQVAHLRHFSRETFISDEEAAKLQDAIHYIQRETIGEIFSNLHKRASELNNANPYDIRKSYIYLTSAIFEAVQEEEKRERIGEQIYYTYLDANNFQQVIKNIYLLADGYAGEKEKEMKEKYGQPIGIAIRFMNENYSRPISMEDAAEAANVSSGYLSRLFKRELDTGFNEYLTQIRLEKAQELLAETALPVKEIASMVGYTDEKYFSKMFKKITGIKPTDYRRLYGN